MKWFTENILEVAGLIIAVVALVVSCQSNDLAKYSHSKLERLECFDKVERVNRELVTNYGDALVSATRIHNYLPEKLDVTKIHSDFQTSMISTIQSAKELKRVVKRYEFKCEGQVEQIVSDIENMNEMSNGTDTYEQFGGFNSKLQDRHHSNISWLFEHDIADACCTKR